VDLAATVAGAAPAGVAYAWLWGPRAGASDPPPPPAHASSPLLQPGQRWSVRLDDAGVYRWSDGGPWPLRATVLDEPGAASAVVAMAAEGFSPSELVLPRGSIVVLENDGAEPHAARLAERDAPLQRAALAPDGTLPATGHGWMRAVVVATAGAQAGSAERDVYVTDALPQPRTWTVTGAFNSSSDPPSTFGFASDGNGTLYVNWSSADAAARTLPTDPAGDQSALTLAVAAADGSRVVASPSPRDAGSLSGAIPSGGATLTVTPSSGLLVEYEVTLTLIYDLVPPAPRSPDPAT
jgi:hypothetical protein